MRVKITMLSVALLVAGACTPRHDGRHASGPVLPLPDTVRVPPIVLPLSKVSTPGKHILFYGGAGCGRSTVGRSSIERVRASRPTLDSRMARIVVRVGYRDESAARAVFGASVTVRVDSTAGVVAREWRATTDENGETVLPAISPGHHLLDVRAIGYEPRLDSLSVRAGYSDTVLVVMPMASIVECE